ncbi:MAG: hypothetical protein WBL09_03730 [Tepidanaerobacteraceae bacterium]
MSKSGPSNPSPSILAFVTADSLEMTTARLLSQPLSFLKFGVIVAKAACMTKLLPFSRMTSSPNPLRSAKPTSKRNVLIVAEILPSMVHYCC